MHNISKFILKKIGWKIHDNISQMPSKCVLCVAPHTSNWDLLLGQLVYSSMRRKAWFLMKKTWFFFPLNIIFKKMGGIPVDRSKSKKESLTQQMAAEFNKRDIFQLAITPEGTRKGNTEWKRGFYFIAQESGVPIVIVIMDYKTKTVTFETTFIPTGNVDVDISTVKSYYSNAEGKNKNNFILNENA